MSSGSEKKETKKRISKDAIQNEKFKKGQSIFAEDDLSLCFYIVRSGVVQIFTKSLHGNKIEIIEIHEGETFGEFALLDRRPRSASALALTDVELVKVTEEGYDHMLTELPLWAASMLRSFTRRLRVMNDRIRALQD